MSSENLCKYELPCLSNFSGHVKSKFGNDFGASLNRLKELSPKCRTKKKVRNVFSWLSKVGHLGLSLADSITVGCCLVQHIMLTLWKKLTRVVSTLVKTLVNPTWKIAFRNAQCWSNELALWIVGGVFSIELFLNRGKSIATSQIPYSFSFKATLGPVHMGLKS